MLIIQTFIKMHGIRPVITVPKTANIKIVDDTDWPEHKDEGYSYTSDLVDR